MAHLYVQPPEGEAFVPIADAVCRIVAAFPQHDIDQARGRVEAEAMIAKLESLGAAEAMVARLRTKARFALACWVSDDGDPDASLGFLLMPGEPIFVGFGSTRHQERSRPLVERLVQVLGYVTSSEQRPSD
jgi:hypothetical protein